jgi:hypothetical protein
MRPESPSQGLPLHDLFQRSRQFLNPRRQLVEYIEQILATSAAHHARNRTAKAIASPRLSL